MEATNAIFLVFGLAILLTSWIVLLVTAWREDYAWGLSAVLVPPFAYFYGLFRLDKAWEAIGLAVLGCVLVMMSF